MIDVAPKVTEAAEAVVVAETAKPTTHLEGFTPWFATVQPFAAKVFPLLKPPSPVGLISVVCAFVVKETNAVNTKSKQTKFRV